MSTQTKVQPSSLALLLQAQDAENRRLRAVVAFYADEKNWVPVVTVGMDGVARSPTARVMAAGGHLPALDALRECTPVTP